MPVTNARRKEYSKQYHFWLANEDAEKLEKRLKDENLTLPEFVRLAMGKELKHAKFKGTGQRTG